MIQMDLKTWMLVLVVSVEVHVHSSVEKPAIRQILALYFSLNFLNLFRLQIFNLPEGFFRLLSPPTVSEKFFNNRFSGFGDVSPIDQKSQVIWV